MKMVFSTKIEETDKRNNMYYNNYVKPVVKPVVFYKINMFENLKSSAECIDCKKTKPNLIK